MWLARKPKGKLAAPPKQRDKNSIFVFFIMMVILGAVMPLFGLSVLVIFAIELLIYVFSKYNHNEKKTTLHEWFSSSLRCFLSVHLPVPIEES